VTRSEGIEVFGSAHMEEKRLVRGVQPLGLSSGPVGGQDT